MKFNFDYNNTFCINLKSRPERWSSVEKVFQTFNLLVTRWEASTPEQVTDNIEGTPTQRACSQSHINLWRHIINQKIEYALIFEDDICLDLRWREKIETFPHNKFDLILLFTDHYYGEPETWQHTQSHSWSTGAYLLHKEGAELLLKFPFKQADRMTRMLQEKTENKHCYSYFPYLACSFNESSDIEGSVSSCHKIIKQLKDANYSLSNYCGVGP